MELNEILIWFRFSSKASLIFWFCFRSIILEKAVQYSPGLSFRRKKQLAQFYIQQSNNLFQVLAQVAASNGTLLISRVKSLSVSLFELEAYGTIL